MSRIVDQTIAPTFLIPFASAIHMQKWIENFLDIKIPLGHVDPDSNSSPVEAMYEAYSVYRDDKCFERPGFIWLSSRDSGKTLCGSILNTILMLHFKSQMVHLAATKKQSEKCLQYCNGFVRLLRPYIESVGRSVVTESKSKIQILNEDSSISYIDVIVANLAGGNSEHVPVASFDELDTLSPQGKVGYEEAKLIPTRYKGRGPLTVKYSTRKFAFGIFEQEIQEIHKTGETLLRWNIVDITQHCSPSRHRPDLPNVDRWIGRDLPLMQKSHDEYEMLHAKDKPKFDKIKAFAGCVTCPILPVCKTRLAHRPVSDVGGLYKEIDFTIRQFKITSPDMGAAQLMCWKPSLSGLVYPRFDEMDNSITLENAWRSWTGTEPKKDLDILDLVEELHVKGVKFYVSGDWGHAHATAFIVSVVLPNGQWWVIDAYSIPGLEFDDILQLAIKIRDTYKPIRWFMDTSEPMFIKTFRRNRMPCADFTKDVMGGIECVRTRVVDASGTRRLKVLKHDRTEVVMMGLRRHHFKLDSLGKPTTEPDDDEAWSDICDSLRYKAQNLFKPKSLAVTTVSSTPPLHKTKREPVDPRQYEDWSVLVRAATQSEGEKRGNTPDGNVFWNFGGDEDDPET